MPLVMPAANSPPIQRLNWNWILGACGPIEARRLALTASSTPDRMAGRLSPPKANRVSDGMRSRAVIELPRAKSVDGRNGWSGMLSQCMSSPSLAAASDTAARAVSGAR